MAPQTDQLLQSLIENENTKVEFDLDNWISDFENGFLDYAKTNPLYQPGYWGQTNDKRPRIRELNIETDAQSNQGYRIVEFFPNRDNEKQSYMFFGTPIEIRIQVAVFMNLTTLFGDRSLGTIVGGPLNQFYGQTRVTFKPQVSLIFIEDPEDVAPTYEAITSELTFRLMNETEATITPASALTLANKIKTVFGGTTAYQWKKGRELWGYTDPARGYHLQIYAWDKVQAKDVIGKILSVQDHPPNWDEHLKDWAKRDSLTNTPIIPPTELIYGESRRRPRKLPVGFVRFKGASLLLDGLANPVQLVDLTGLKPSALVKG